MRYQGFPVAFLVIVAIFLTRISPEPALYGSSSTPFKRMVHRINPEDTEEGDFIPEKRTEVEKSGLSGLLSLTVRLGGGSAEGYGVGALAELQGVDFRINECKRRILDLRSELYHYLEELSRLQKRRKEILATAPYTPSPPPPQLHTPLPPFEPGVGMVVGGGDAVGPEGEVTLERHVARQRAASSRGVRPPGTPDFPPDNFNFSIFSPDHNASTPNPGLTPIPGLTPNPEETPGFPGDSEGHPKSRGVSPSPRARKGGDEGLDAGEKYANDTKQELSEFARLVLSRNLHNMSAVPHTGTPRGLSPGPNHTAAEQGVAEMFDAIGANLSAGAGSRNESEQVFPGIRILDDLFQNYIDWDMPRLEETAARATTPAPESSTTKNITRVRAGRPRKETLGKISAESLTALRPKLEGEVLSLDDPTDGVMHGEADPEDVKPWSDLGRLRSIVERDGPAGSAARAYHGGRYYVQLLEQRGIKPGQRGEEVTQVKRDAGFRPDDQSPEHETDLQKPTFKTANQWKTIYLTLSAYPRLANYFRFYSISRAYRDFRLLRRELDSLRRALEKNAEAATEEDRDLMEFYREGFDSFPTLPGTRRRKRSEGESDDDYKPPRSVQKKRHTKKDVMDIDAEGHPERDSGYRHSTDQESSPGTEREHEEGEGG